MTDLDLEPEDWAKKIGRPEVMAFHLLMDFIGDVIVHTTDAMWFREKYKGRIALLHADMRRYLIEELDKIGASQ